jgi:TolB-like protein/DNA-binding winged helix-turn-helix (wHTH) protein
MASTAPGPKGADCKLRFDVYEADPRSGELRKHGVRIPLEERPFRALLILLRRANELVTREELQSQLWPSDTFVDFDHGLNTAIRKIRLALNDSANAPRFIETVGRRGYRFLPAVEQVVAVASARVVVMSPAPLAVAAPLETQEPEATIAVDPASIESSSPVTPVRRRQLPMAVAIGVVVALTLAAGGIAWFVRSHKTSQIDSLAVLPFANVGGDARTDYLSDGITESLIDNLAHVPDLKVKSRHSVFRYKGKEVDVQRVGEDLGVAALVSGRVTPHGDTIDVSAELTNVSDNTEIWGEHYSAPATNIVSLQQQIAGDIADKLRSQMSSAQKQQVTKQGTKDPEAYDLYLKGRYEWTKRTPASLAAALSYFNQAIAKDPGYAMAYLGLADAYGVLPSHGGSPAEDFSKSNAAARRALELDPTLAEPHADLAADEMEYEFDFAGGEAEYKKAFALDPSDATAHQWYAQDLGSLGRTQEALAEAARAHDLDPLSPIVSAAGVRVRVAGRQYDQAIELGKRQAKDNPTFSVVHQYLAQAYWAKAMYPQAIEEWKTYAQLDGNPNEIEFAAALDEGYKAGGWKEALQRGIAARLAQRKNGYASAYYIAQLYAQAGDKDQAFQWLDAAYRERDGLINLKTDFTLDPIRSDPRFAVLVKKVGLPQ